MYSISSYGKLGALNNTFVCSEIRTFKSKTCGDADETARRSRFGYLMSLSQNSHRLEIIALDALLDVIWSM